jgi:YD repeat-containing protein
MITNKEYQYNSNNYLPEKITTTDNQGKTIIEQQIKYPYSYTTTVATGMKSKHLVNAPIETLSLKNNMVVSSIKTEYKDTLSTYLPKSIYRLNTTTPATLSNYDTMYSPEVFFDKYTSVGKYRELLGKDGIPIVYLWGYNNQYPIAEIKNATFTEVSNALTGITPDQLASSIVPDTVKVEALRQSSSLSKAMITTYTYKPLIGMTSATDPRGVTTYYGYDSLNRLKETYMIENGVKKILQKYDYHYSNQ